MNDVVLPLTVGLLFVFEFFLSLACYSLRDFSRSRLDEICRRHHKDTRFSLILKRYERALLATEMVFSLVAIGLLLVSVYWLGGPSEVTDHTGWAMFALRWGTMALFVLFAMIIFPWAIARVAGEGVLYHSWPLLDLFQAVLLRPTVAMTFELDKVLHRVSGLETPNGDDASALTEEIRSVVDEGQRGGILESQARTMIHRVMELQQEDVAAIMTPRTDMMCISFQASLEEARQKLLDAGHSRVPVIGESTDDIIGILYAKDLLRYMDGTQQDAQLSDIVREPFYVPETTGIDKLLEDMKRMHLHVAIVLDEYGGVAGLVTMEDVLEEIVGEIVDEYDADEEESIMQIEPGVTEVDARVHIDDLNKEFGYNFPEDKDFDTIGGFVFSFLGRVPETDESFTWHHLRITVLEADKRKIVKLRIEVDHSLAASVSDDL